MTFTKNIDENLELIKSLVGNSPDIVFRNCHTGINGIRCSIIYIEGLTDSLLLNSQLMKPLMLEMPLLKIHQENPVPKLNALKIIKDRILTVGDVKEASNPEEAVFLLMTGETILIIDGFDSVLLVSLKGWQARTIQEPETEALIRGPRDGFVETLRFNTTLLRRKMRDPNMIIENMKIGTRSKTDVAVVYIKDIVNPKLLDQVRKRLKSIDTDIILESGQIEQLIQDSYLSPFPQVQPTERPDKVISAISEGRVGILVDGTPFALILPVSFFQFFQSPEDYYERWIIGTLLRTLRLAAFFLATFTPALYIAIVSFHPGMIPTGLAMSIAAAREGVPFPSIVEALLMETTIELLREAGARLPKPIGQTIGIVGGIIIGDAAVRAGLTSPIMVIVVAITAVASFVIPSYNAAITFRVLRFPMMLAASFLGLYGATLGLILVTSHMVVLKSFGVNYLAPLAPFHTGGWKDTLIRAPYHLMKQRPEFLEPIDLVRMENNNWRS